MTLDEIKKDLEGRGFTRNQIEYIAVLIDAWTKEAQLRTGKSPCVPESTPPKPESPPPPAETGSPATAPDDNP